MLTDPFKLPLASGTDISVVELPLIGVGTDTATYSSANFRSGFASTKGRQFVLSHQYNKRFRHTIRLNTVERDSDGVADTASVILIVDTSPAPYEDASDTLAALAHCLINGFATAVSGTTDVTAVHQDVTDFLNGES